MATVQLKTLLVKKTGVKTYQTDARTAGEVMDELREKYGESIERYLKDCLIMVDGKNIDDLKGLKTRVKPRSEVSVFPRVAGG